MGRARDIINERAPQPVPPPDVGDFRARIFMKGTRDAYLLYKIYTVPLIYFRGMGGTKKKRRKKGTTHSQFIIHIFYNKTFRCENVRFAYAHRTLTRMLCQRNNESTKDPVRLFSPRSSLGRPVRCSHDRALRTHRYIILLLLLRLKTNKYTRASVRVHRYIHTYIHIYIYLTKYGYARNIVLIVRARECEPWAHLRTRSMYLLTWRVLIIILIILYLYTGIYRYERVILLSALVSPPDF